MNNQRTFIDQLYILFGLGIVLLIFSAAKLYYPHTQIGDTEKVTLRLVWNGDSLMVDDTANDHALQESPMPAELHPLFFQPIPINSADVELLQTIRGIGPHLAAEIDQTRERIGRFKRAEDLLLVPGIGQKKMNLLKDSFHFNNGD